MSPRTEGAARAHLTSLVAVFLLRLSLLLLLSPFTAYGTALAGVTVSAVRVWPAEDYTRLTLESGTPIHYGFFSLKDPPRLVLDLKGVDLNAVLKGLVGKVAPSDPYMKQVRVARFKPGVVRVVVDLKSGAVSPSVFALKPYGQYGYRLVLDIYPDRPADPLMALVRHLGAERSAAAKGGRQAGSLALKGAAVLKEPEHGREQEKASDNRRAEPKRPIIVAIDPGHGGEDSGAIGVDGVEEKNVTLAIARRLRAMMDKQPGMRGVLTRNGDYFVPLQERRALARKAKADLFVSIHADAYINSRARGTSVFALSERGATSVAARWLAKSENASDLVGGVDLNMKDPYLARTLLDLTQTATINDSLKLGKAVLSQIGKINLLHSKTVDQANFVVLRSPDIPSILVETAFLSNPEGERELVNPVFQAKMAHAILAGIKRYLAESPSLVRYWLAQK